MHQYIWGSHASLLRNRRMSLQRWSFCNLAVLGSERVNPSWKRYFLRRCHLETKMTEGKSGGYTCKSLRGHTGMLSLPLSPSLSLPLFLFSPLFTSPHASLQAGWWVLRTWREIQLSVLTSGPAAPRCAAPPPTARSERGTSSMWAPRPFCRLLLQLLNTEGSHVLVKGSQLSLSLS